jgi:hypothetical protein
MTSGPVLLGVASPHGFGNIKSVTFSSVALRRGKISALDIAAIEKNFVAA